MNLETYPNQIRYEQNQERAAFVHVCESNISLVAPDFVYDSADLFDFISAAWTPDCTWSPMEAAADFVARAE